MNMKVTPRDQIYLIALGVIAIVLLGFYFLIRPAYLNMRVQSKQMAAVNQQVNNAMRVVAEAPQLKKNIQKQLDACQTKAGALLPSVDHDLLNVWLVHLMNGAGLSLSNATFSDAQAVQITADAQSGTAKAANSTQAGGTVPPYELGTLADTYRRMAGSSSSSSAGTSSSRPTSSQPASSQPASSQPVSSANAANSSTASTQNMSAKVLQVDVTLTMTGTYAQAMSFLDALKNTGKTVQVTSLQISGASITVTVRCYGALKPSDSDQTLVWTLPAVSGKPSLM